MAISYQKLWDLLDMSELKKKDLQDRVKFGPHTMAKLNRNEVVSMDIALRICKALHCDISEIMEITED
jgi:DNA-binding Xre family transcriptional regulator